MSDPTPGEARRAAERDEQGFALVIVLWIFIVLFVIGAEFAQGMRHDATATMNFADSTQSYYLSTAAANLMFFRLKAAYGDGTLGVPLGVDEEDQGKAATTPPPPVDGKWHQVDLWGAPVWVKVADEGSKIPLNYADETVLNHVLGNLGLPIEEAQAITDSILDWRDKDDEHRLNGAESDYYGGLPRPYVAKNARFDSIEELLLVKGVTPELFYGESEDVPSGLRDLFTVFGPARKLNVQLASPEVLRVFFGLDQEELDQILSVRDGEGSDGAMRDVLAAKVPLAIADMVASESRPSVVSVEVQAQMASSRVKSHIAAVVNLDSSDEGIFVDRWMDQLAPVEVQ